MRLIADGVVDRDGVTGLAAQLGYTPRQLERMLQSELGAGPLALARAQRVQTARVLIETTAAPFGDVAFAAGFASIRQFNDTIRSACGTTPTAMRQHAIRQSHGGRTPSATPMAGQTLSLRLPVRLPFSYRGAFGHLAATAVPGCEEVRNGAYRRTLRLPSGNGAVSLTPHPGHVQCLLVLDEIRDLSTAISRCRRLLDLDADPTAVMEALGRDPALTEIVAREPGQRIPRTVDERELALRAVLGQQISTAAARTHASRLAIRYGQPINDPIGGLTHCFPSVEDLAELDPAHLAVPTSRRRTFQTLVSRLTSGEISLDPGCDWFHARQQLLKVPGIGPWTVEIIAMRGLGDPDAFPATDLGVRAAAKGIGLPADARGITTHSARWRPWRSYAVQHLWSTLSHCVNDWPPKESNDDNDPLSNNRQSGGFIDSCRHRTDSDAFTDGGPNTRARSHALAAHR
jgi:AraC family transcriptional regulator of adaptative response / DNA-3-methyladenine glycosylase II